MSTQLLPEESHRRHWYAYVGAGEPVQVPAAAESVKPTFGVPEIDGATVLAGVVVGTAVIETLFEVAEASDVDDATSVYEPATLNERLLNVAVPLTALTVVVPLSVPPTGPVPTDSVMAFVAPALNELSALRTSTFTGLIAVLTVVVEGCTENARPVPVTDVPTPETMLV